MDYSLPENVFNDSDKEDLAEKLVDKLTTNNVDSDDPVRMRKLYQWFPRESNSEIREVVDELIDDNDCPLRGSTYGEVYLRECYWELFSPFDGSLDQ